VRLRTTLLPCLALLLCVAATGCSDMGIDSAQEHDGAVIWRGFDQRWTHNHRWNRFGNWVEEDPDSACEEPFGCYELAHAAASGTSGDVADFTSHFTTVSTRGVAFLPLRGEVTLAADFGEALYIRVEEVRVPVAELDRPSRFRDRDRYVALLNGFDLGSQGPADKPVAFFIEAGDARYDEVEDELVVQWRTYLSMDCTSAECWLTARNNDAFDYKLTVHLLLLAADDALVPTFPERVVRDYTWDAPPHVMPGSPFIFPVVLGHGHNEQAEELDLPPVEGLIQGFEDEPEPAVGLRRLAISLFPFPGTANAPADQHMLDWESAVRPGAFEDGKLAWELDLMFKNWTEGMQVHQVTAYPEVGAARMEVDLVMLQFAQGAGVSHRTWADQLEWGGADASALGEDAVRRASVASEEGE
jgi:hypothetical protein